MNTLRDHSLRNFPLDLLAVSGFPVVIVAGGVSSLLSARGTTWVVAAVASLSVALLGAALIFVAKLPLYRERRFFSFGFRAIPESRHGFYRWGCRLSILG